MKSIRLGKDIALTWTITTDGEVVSLEDSALTWILTDPKGMRQNWNSQSAAPNLDELLSET